MTLPSSGSDSSDDQQALFDLRAPWEFEWVDMPEFEQDDLSPWKSIYVHFASPGDMKLFAELVEQRVGERTQSIWFPEAEIGRFANKRYADEPA